MKQRIFCLVVFIATSAVHVMEYHHLGGLNHLMGQLAAVSQQMEQSKKIADHKAQKALKDALQKGTRIDLTHHRDASSDVFTKLAYHKTMQEEDLRARGKVETW